MIKNIFSLLLICEALTDYLSFVLAYKALMKYNFLESATIYLFECTLFLFKSSQMIEKISFSCFITRSSLGSTGTFFPSCVALGWFSTQGCPLAPPSHTKACPADWAEGLRGLILVFSTWRSPSEASVLLCLMWAFSLQRKQLFWQGFLDHHHILLPLPRDQCLGQFQ